MIIKIQKEDFDLENEVNLIRKKYLNIGMIIYQKIIFLMKIILRH